MPTNTLNMRICSKTDSYQNWTDGNVTPLNGEICVVVIPAAVGAVVQAPTTMIKVGDGVTPFNDLKFIGSLAADVYDWAKGKDKPAYSASEIDGLEDYIESLGLTGGTSGGSGDGEGSGDGSSSGGSASGGSATDTDTQYQIVENEDGNYQLQSKSLTGEWTDVAGSLITLPTQEVLDSLEALKDVDVSDLIDSVEANTKALEALNGTGDGSVASVVAAAIAEVVGGADEKFDTLKEIADFLLNDVSGATDLKEAMDALEELVGDTSVTEQVKDAIEAALGLGNSDGEDGEGGSTSLLSKIATTGNINDLLQTEGDYVVINCGSATEVV